MQLIEVLQRLKINLLSSAGHYTNKSVVAAAIFFAALFPGRILATTYTSVAPGAYNTVTNWSPNGTPNLTSDIIIINHLITFPAGSYTSSSGTTSITVNSGGTFKIVGDLTLSGSGMKITVNTGGAIDVSGILTLNNASRITHTAGSVKAGSLILTDNANSLYNYTAGTLTLTGDLYVGASETFGYTPSVAIPGNVTVKNGGTVTASSLGGSITLNSSSKLNLNVTGTITPSSISLTDNSSCEIVVNSGTLKSTSDLTITGNKITVNSGGGINFPNLTVNSSATVSIASGATATLSSLTTGNNSSAVFTNAGTTTISGSITSSGVITNSGTMNVGGNLTQNNTSNQFTTSGTLNVTGNVQADGKIQLNPGTPGNSEMTVTGSVTVTANDNLIVGTSVNPPTYADLVVKQNVSLTGSGDITVDKNGRFVIFGNINSPSGGGTIIDLKPGAQVYVNGNVNLAGNGDHINNENTAQPHGLYVNGTITYTGGGSSSQGTAEESKASMQVNDAPFYAYIAGLSGSPLPVTLLFFKVIDVSFQGIQLAWATASELNFNQFVIERSTDGQNFIAIGSQKGSGTSRVRHDYKFTDSAPVIGKLYYRLRSEDIDGSFEYLTMIATEYSSTKRIEVYPNPASGNEINIVFNFDHLSTDQVVLYDVTGAVIGEYSVTGLVNTINFKNTLSPGIYFLRYRTTSFEQLVKILVK